MNRDGFALSFIATVLLLAAGCSLPPQTNRQAQNLPPFQTQAQAPAQHQHQAQNPGSYNGATAPAYPSSPQGMQPPASSMSSPPWPGTGAGFDPTQQGAATWQLTSAPRSQALGHGATLHECQARSISGNAEVTVVVFDSRQCVLKVIDQPTPHAGGGVLDQIMRSNRAIAGVNGGFFHPNFQPLGIFIAGGQKIGTFTSNKLLSGSLLVIGSEPYLIWNSEFLGDAGVTDLIQSGPRLVDGGAPISSLNGTKQAVRTFVATDGQRLWAVGVVRQTTLAGLADLLAESQVIPGLRITRALNLDGGHSSAFWARTSSGREISQPGWSTVRNYLAVVPK